MKSNDEEKKEKKFSVKEQYPETWKKINKFSKTEKEILKGRQPFNPEPAPSVISTPKEEKVISNTNDPNESEKVITRTAPDKFMNEFPKEKVVHEGTDLYEYASKQAKETKSDKEVSISEMKDISSLDPTKEKLNVMKLAIYLQKNKLVPSTLKLEEIVMCVHVALALGYKKFGNITMVIKNMTVMGGCVHLFGDLPLSLVQRSGELEDIKEFFIDENYNEICYQNKNLNAPIFAAICEMKRKGYKRMGTFSLTQKDLELSGGVALESGSFKFSKWSSKNNKIIDSTTWLKYPKIHWTRRLRAWAIKSLFADKLQSSTIMEYDGLATSHTINSKGELKNVFEDKDSSGLEKFEKTYVIEKSKGAETNG